MSKDLILMDRNGLADLVVAIQELTLIIQERAVTYPLSEYEEEKLKYVNKLIQTSTQSFENNNQ